MAKTRQRKTEMPPLARIFSDVPREKSKEQILAFGFEPLATTLAELALNAHNDMPFTVVVRAQWGRGKTTLLKETRRQLGEPHDDGLRQMKTVWFNAWKYPDDDTVLAGLLGALLSEMKQGDLFDQLATFVNGRKYKWAKGVITAAAPWLPSWLELDLESSRYDSVQENRAFYDSFKELFSELLYVWHERTGAWRDTQGFDVAGRLADLSRHKGLAIFIDDLDRCSDHRIKDVLEAINLFLDLPGVCFYLALDWDRVRDVLASAEGMDTDRAERFLEKIVQISVDLPEVQETGIRAYLDELSGADLPGLLGGSDDEVAANALVQVMARQTPRYVKRVLNDLSMTLALLRNSQASGKPALPAEAVVAWHLLREAHPQKWLELRADLNNLLAFVNNWREFDANVDAQSADPEIGALRDGPVGELLPRFVELNETQLQELVFYGSPPDVGGDHRDGAGRAPGRGASGRHLGGDPDQSYYRGGDRHWALVEGGEFEMGDAADSDATPHRVRLSSYRMLRFPVTNAQYLEYVQASNAPTPAHWIDGAIPEGLNGHPVVNVSWEDAVAYCSWLTERAVSLVRSEVTCALPTEAQWEFAARGEAGRRYPWGDDQPSNALANFGDSDRGTTPSGRYPDGRTPNTGIEDLAGNVWEWCADWYGDYPHTTVVDPTGPDSGSGRVLRGGAFDDSARYLRAAYRDDVAPGDAGFNVGFRVVWLSRGGRG